jgi:hypothetical protein
MADLPEYVKGELKEDGQTLDFPILRDGILIPTFRAAYHIHTGSQTGHNVNKNLLYLALPSGIELELGEFSIPISREVKGETVDVKTLRFPDQRVITDGVCVAKINPGVPYKINAPDGTAYHSFEMLETPDSYRNPNHSNFVTLPNGEIICERYDKIIKMAGAMIYPESCAFRIPGWLAKEFNGSPEFGFAYSPFKEPRKGEVLHYHQEIMEPYLGLEGTIPLFIATEDGREPLEAADLEGITKTYLGEIVEISKGDVVLPLPGVEHKILFNEKTKFPFTQYCMNYASKPLNEVPPADRVVLERKEE